MCHAKNLWASLAVETLRKSQWGKLLIEIIFSAVLNIKTIKSAHSFFGVFSYSLFEEHARLFSVIDGRAEQAVLLFC